MIGLTEIERRIAESMLPCGWPSRGDDGAGLDFNANRAEGAAVWSMLVHIAHSPFSQWKRFMSRSILSLHRVALFGLVAVAGLVGCQTSSPERDVPTSEQTRVVARYTLLKNEAYKIADSSAWSVGEASGSGGRPLAVQSTDTSVTYSATLDLAAPLNGRILTLALWRLGIRFMLVDFKAAGSDGTLEIVPGSVRADSIALALLGGLDASKSSPIQDRVGLVELYAKWLLANDVRVQGFPANAPNGITAAEVVQTALVLSSKNGKTLADQAGSWGLGVSLDSANVLVLDLIRNTAIASADSAVLFPPPPIRVVTPVSVKGSPKVSGDLVEVAGAFEWNENLGLVAFGYFVLSGSDTVREVVLSGLPSPSSSAHASTLDGAAKLAVLSGAVEGDYQLVVIAQDGNGNQARSVAPFHVLPGDAIRQNVPVVRLLDPSDNSIFPFETSEVLTTWRVTTPQGALASVTLDGHPAQKKDDSTWVAKVALEPTGKPQTFALRAENSDSQGVTEAVHLTRRSDLTGPVVTWISPASDMEVEYGVTSVGVRIKAVDPSGIDTILIGGQKPDSVSASGDWIRRIPLVVVGAPMAIVVRVVDGAKNATESRMTITRQNPPTDIPPKAVLLAPASKTGTLLPFDSGSILVRWSITDPYGVDSSSVLIDGKPAVSESGNIWSARVVLPATGSPTAIPLVVRNKNGVSGGDVVLATRAKDTAKPRMAMVVGTRNVGYDSVSVVVSWRVSDNDALAAVTIQGVQADSLGGLFFSKVLLALGVNRIAFRATDRTGNNTDDTAVVVRAADTSVPRLLRVQGTESRLVGVDDSEVRVAWLAVDDGTKLTVRIDGQEVSNASGEFGRTVSVSPGSRVIRAEVVDRAGLVGRDSIVLSRPPRKPGMTPSSGSYAGPIAVGIDTLGYDSCQYALDTGDWVGYHGGVSVSWSGSVRARGWVGGVVSEAASVALKATSGVFSDVRDQEKYSWIRIGDKIWMAENLRFAADSSWCVDDSIFTCKQAGRFYKWTGAMKIPVSYSTSVYLERDATGRGICPEGWHLPTWAEFDSLGIDQARLKSANGWLSSNGTNASGFNLLPTGILAAPEAAKWRRNYAWLWTRDQADGTYAARYAFAYFVADPAYPEDSPDDFASKVFGLAVRCAKD